ncbi:hypothetical protein LAZ40_05510 [Cereibacter sphaeroides]|uniref:hypothetical protein n=1 Tax=Cereibacter sphaeroides TaxID=1063 RepID=UPI001F344949|nr:hypothetical protein [Cereibacter sphaeroides]MCE6958506.1 hypothetical protein [Cereibacter sphaeroides]MCE6972832.1 hypothetical protein [Cereibacter sphaeroides]
MSTIDRHARLAHLLDKGVHPDFAGPASYGSAAPAAEVRPLAFSRIAIEATVDTFVKFLDLPLTDTSRLRTSLLRDIVKLFPKRQEANLYQLDYVLTGILRGAATGHCAYVGDIQIRRVNASPARMTRPFLEDRDRELIRKLLADPANGRRFAETMTRELWKEWEKAWGGKHDFPAWSTASTLQKQPIIDIGRGLFAILRRLQAPKYPAAARLRLPGEACDFTSPRDYRVHDREADPMEHYPAWLRDLRRQESLALLDRPEHADLVEAISDLVPVPEISERGAFGPFLSQAVARLRWKDMTRAILDELETGPDNLPARLETLLAGFRRQPPLHAPATPAQDDPMGVIRVMAEDLGLLPVFACEAGPLLLARLAGIRQGDTPIDDLGQRLLTSGLNLAGSDMDAIVTDYERHLRREYPAGSVPDPQLMACEAQRRACEALGLDRTDETEAAYLASVSEALGRRFGDRIPARHLSDIRKVDTQVSGSPCAAALKERIGRCPNFARAIAEEILEPQNRTGAMWVDMSRKQHPESFSILIGRDLKLDATLARTMNESRWLAPHMAARDVRDADVAFMMAEVVRDLGNRSGAPAQDLADRLFGGFNGSLTTTSLAAAWRDAVDALDAGRDVTDARSVFQARLGAPDDVLSFMAADAVVSEEDEAPSP